MPFLGHLNYWYFCLGTGSGMNLSWLIIPAQLESVSPEVVQTVLEGVLLETTSVREVHGSTARLAQLWAR